MLRKEGERGGGRKRRRRRGEIGRIISFLEAAGAKKEVLRREREEGTASIPFLFACLLLLRSHIVRRGCCRMEEEGEEGHITWEEEPGNEVSLNLLLGPEWGGGDFGNWLAAAQQVLDCTRRREA